MKKTILALTPALTSSSTALACTPQELQVKVTPLTAKIQTLGQTVGAAASTLPGGASSLNETYKDWRVACVQPGTTKRCALVAGTLVLPFGFALDSGVAFQVDDKPAMQPIRLRTCVFAGCLVNVSFDAPTLRAGAVLKVKATADGSAAAPLSISLRGFGTALDRVAALA